MIRKKSADEYFVQCISPPIEQFSSYLNWKNDNFKFEKKSITVWSVFAARIAEKADSLQFFVYATRTSIEHE